jgi:sorbitol-specific phosphotransferase system component IIBC
VGKNGSSAKINKVGFMGLVLSLVAFIAASYVNSNFSSSRDTVTIFQLIYALFGVISFVGFIMTSIATIKVQGLTKRIAFAVATLVTLLLTGWLAIASVLVGAFTNF